MTKIGGKPTLYVVAVLCVGQFVWTMHEEMERLGWTGLALSILAVIALNVGFEWLWRIGDKLERHAVPMVIAHPEQGSKTKL